MSSSPIQPIRQQASEAITIEGLQKGYTYDTNKEIPALWGIFAPHIDSIEAMIGCTTYGVVFDQAREKEAFQYMAGVAVPSESAPDARFSRIEIPAQNYAVFEHVGPLWKLCETLDAIYQQWAPTVTLDPESMPGMMEVYGPDFCPDAESTRLEIWIPYTP